VNKHIVHNVTIPKASEVERFQPVSDLQGHSRSLVFFPISLPLLVSLSCTFFDIISNYFLKFTGVMRLEYIKYIKTPSAHASPIQNVLLGPKNKKNGLHDSDHHHHHSVMVGHCGAIIRLEVAWSHCRACTSEDTAGPLWSVTDDDRRQIEKQYCPPHYV